MGNNAFLKMFLDDLNDAFNKIITAERKNEEREKKETMILTADKLNELKWMSPSQLRAIFGNKPNPPKVADDPAAYRVLKWMSESQLNAIFGKEGIN